MIVHTIERQLQQDSAVDHYKLNGEYHAKRDRQ
jgi:hypothetical protein